MADKSTCSNEKYFLTLVFASIFLVSLGVTHNAFAMGPPPGSCSNEYDGMYTNATLIVGNQTYYPLKNNVIFQLTVGQSYYLTTTIHVPNQSTQGNSLSGSLWYSFNAIGYDQNYCSGAVNPNENYTINSNFGFPGDYNPNVNNTISVYWAPHGFSYTVNWVAKKCQCSAPQNLQATAGNSQIMLSWFAPTNNGGSAITNYNVYRGTSSGSETLLAVDGNVTSYRDTTITNGQTYFYKVTAVNSIGESPQSNEASATPTTPVDHVVATIPVNGAFGVTTNPNTHMTYVANGNGYHIQVINDATNTIVTNVTTASAPSSDNACHTYNVALNPVTNMIYASNDACVYGPPSGVSQWIPQTVSVINGTNNNVVTTVQVWGGQFRSQPPQPIAVNPATNKIYALVDDEAYLAVINGATSQVVTDITMSNHTTDNEYPTSDIAINPQTNTIYVLDNNIIHVVDGNTDVLVTNFSWGKSSIQGIGVNPTTNQIYVSNSDNSVSVIDGATYKVVSTIPSGTYGAVGVNPATNKIYVSYPSFYPVSHNTSTNTNIVSVIDGATNTLLDQATVGQSPYGIGIDIIANKIYVSNIASSTVSVIDSGSSNTSTVPSAPQNLQSTVGNSQVTLSWTAPANNGGSAITGYEVERSRGNLSFGGFSNSTSATFFSAPNSTAFTDNGLGASTTYNYTVFAKNSVGPSSHSNTASATTSATSPQPTGITLNNVQSTSGTVSTSPYQITLSNFNNGNGSNQLLVVGVSANNNNVASVTFGGTHLTKKVSSFSNNDAEFWYLKNSTGTGNIVVTMAGSTSAVVGAYSFSGVNQSSPLPTSTTNHNSVVGSPTVSLATTNPNNWVLDLPSIYGGVTLGSPTFTQQWNTHVPNAITGASSSVMVQSPGSVTCKWTASSGEMWDDVAVEVNAYSTSGTITISSPPTGLAATTVSSSQINLSWTAPTNNGGATITGYKIERSTDSGSTWSSLVANTGSASTKYSDTGLTQNTSYAYRVYAINSAGVSAPSNVSSATTPSTITAPSPPTGLTTISVSSSQINLSWSAPSSNGGSAITGYDVDRSTNNGNTWSIVTSNTGSTTTAYNDTGLSPSTSYTYRVSAINSAGTSSPSNISSATTGTVTTSGIKLDNVQSTSGSTSTSNPIMLADFNVGTGNNRLLVVGVSADNSNVGSITFGGVSLTKKVSSFHNNDAEFWYLVNPTGTGAIVVTMKGTTSAIVGAYSFSGVNQTSPLPTNIANYNSAASSPTVSITTKFANDFILDLPSIYGGVTLGASTGTQQWNTHMPGAITGASSSKVVPTPGAITCKWTASSGDLWDDVAVEVGASK